MAQGAAARRAVARLRADIAALEGRTGRFADATDGVCGGPMPDKGTDVLATGDAKLDGRLGGGIPAAGLTECHALHARDAGALTGFAACLAVLAGERMPGKPVLWIMPLATRAEAGCLHGLGLAALGLEPSRLMLVMPRTLEDALWVCEEAARCAGLAATVFDMRGASAKFGLVQTRRLHVRAQESVRPVFLLRQGAGPDASAAPVRLCISPAASAPDRVLAGTAAARSIPGGIGPPGFTVIIDKNKAGPAGSVHTLFWNSHERHFHSAPSGLAAGHSVSGLVRTRRAGSGSHSATGGAPR